MAMMNVGSDDNPQWVDSATLGSGGGQGLESTTPYTPPSAQPTIPQGMTPVGAINSQPLGLWGPVYQDAQGNYFGTSVSGGMQPLTGSRADGQPWTPQNIAAEMGGTATAAAQDKAAIESNRGITGAGGIGDLLAAGFLGGVVLPASGLLGAAGTTAAPAVGGGAMDTGAFSDLVASTAAPAADTGISAATGGMAAPPITGGGTGLSPGLAASGMAGSADAATGLQLPASLGGTATGLGLSSSAAGSGMNAGISAAAPSLGALLGPVASGLTPTGVAAGATDLTVPGMAAGTEPGTVGATSGIGPGQGGLLNTSGLGVGDVGLGSGISSLPGLSGTPSTLPSGTVPATTPGGTGAGGTGSGLNLGSLGGLSALLPGLAMGASLLAKPKEDTSALTGIAQGLQAKAGTEKPDTSALSSLAGQMTAKAGADKIDTSALSALAGKLSGPGTLQDLLTTQAQSLIPSVSTGNLPPGAQALVQNALSDSQNSIKSHYASMGLSGSTMEGQELSAANARAQGMAFNLAQQLTQTGLTEASAATGDITAGAGIQGQIGSETLAGSSLASSDLATAANMQQSIINSGLAASGLSTTDLADSATIYKEIMNTQLAQDSALQSALSNFASASAIGVGLASQGKTDTSGASGIGTALSSIGSGISSGWDSFLKSIGVGSSSGEAAAPIDQMIAY